MDKQNLSNAFAQGFVKKAAAYGLSSSEALELLKSSNWIDKMQDWGEKTFSEVFDPKFKSFPEFNPQAPFYTTNKAGMRTLNPEGRLFAYAQYPGVAARNVYEGGKMLLKGIAGPVAATPGIIKEHTVGRSIPRPAPYLTVNPPATTPPTQ